MITVMVKPHFVNLQQTLKEIVENYYYFSILHSIPEAVAISTDSPRYSAITRRDMKRWRVGLRSCTIYDKTG